MRRKVKCLKHAGTSQDQGKRKIEVFLRNFWERFYFLSVLLRNILERIDVLCPFTCVFILLEVMLTKKIIF